MSKERFKQFVRNNSILVERVNNNEISWQKLYEMYNLYGENSGVWDKYLNNITDNRSESKITKSNELAFRELVNMVKNIDLEKVRNGITGVQKAISLVQDLGFGGTNNNKETYQERPLYKHFED